MHNNPKKMNPILTASFDSFDILRSCQNIITNYSVSILFLRLVVFLNGKMIVYLKYLRYEDAPILRSL